MPCFAVTAKVQTTGKQIMKPTVNGGGTTAVLDRPTGIPAPGKSVPGKPAPGTPAAGKSVLGKPAPVKPALGKSDAEKQEMQKKMEAAATPGPAHKALAAFLGDWKAEVKCWCEPGGTPTTSQGTSKADWILNGHFLDAEFHGEMMGKPFTGRTLMGYDNIKGTFNSVWVSDLQTSIMTCEGKGEKGNKVITLQGTSSCPGTGRTDVSIKTVFRVLSPDSYIFEMFNEGAKSMEITYTRK